MMGLNAATVKASDMLQLGEIPDLATANVEIVRMMGVRIINSRMPRECRKALQDGVKAGRLGRLKKDGLMPEAFFHPNSKGRAISERRAIAQAGISAIQKICG